MDNNTYTMTIFSGDELKRLVELIPQTDPRTPAYGILLENLERFAASIANVDWVLHLDDPEVPKELTEQKEETIADANIVPFNPPTSEAEKFSPAVVGDPTPVEPEETKVAEEYKLADVKAALSAAKAAGKIGSPKQWIRDNAGCDGLEAIPAAMYGEVISKLKGLL